MDDLDFVETMISACGSAEGMFEAAQEVKYQISVRPNEDLGGLPEAYESIKNWSLIWAGLNDSYSEVFDQLIEKQCK